MQMRGHGNKWTRKKDLAIAALLSEPTIEKAAILVGVSVITLQRWLKHPDFKNRYKAACYQVMEEAILSLQRASNLAVEALKRNLDCGRPTIEVRAALGVLDQSTKATGMLDFELRLSALEEGLSKMRKDKW